MSRATQGVIVQRLRDGDRISAVAMVDSANVDSNGDDAEPLPFAGLSEVAPEIAPYVSADAAEAAGEQAAEDLDEEEEADDGDDVKEY
jgi:hypothetical protein